MKTSKNEIFNKLDLIIHRVLTSKIHEFWKNLVSFIKKANSYFSLVNNTTLAWDNLFYFRCNLS